MANLLTIRQVVKQIVSTARPEKVILFGSYAEGEPTQDSDADLLVIMNTNQRPVRAAAAIAADIDHPMPIDIIVRTPAQIADRLEAKDTFISHIAAKGIVLYEA